MVRVRRVHGRVQRQGGAERSGDLAGSSREAGCDSTRATRDAEPRTGRPGSHGSSPCARAHFADHCASCHANNGSGDTPIGRCLYPKAPDLRLPDTQKLSDGELVFIIHHGIRFTGMPAWGTGTLEDDLDSWKLVHFIRRLPHLTPAELEEMQALNPKSPHQREEEAAFDRFLQGDDAAASPVHDHH